MHEKLCSGSVTNDTTTNKAEATQLPVSVGYNPLNSLHEMNSNTVGQELIAWFNDCILTCRQVKPNFKSNNYDG